MNKYHIDIDNVGRIIDDVGQLVAAAVIVFAYWYTFTAI